MRSPRAVISPPSPLVFAPPDRARTCNLRLGGPTFSGNVKQEQRANHFHGKKFGSSLFLLRLASTVHILQYSLPFSSHSVPDSVSRFRSAPMARERRKRTSFLWRTFQTSAASFHLAAQHTKSSLNRQVSSAFDSTEDVGHSVAKNAAKGIRPNSSSRRDLRPVPLRRVVFGLRRLVCRFFRIHPARPCLLFP